MKKNIVKIIFTGIVFPKNPFTESFGRTRFDRFIGDGYPNRFCHHVTIQFGFSTTELPDYIGSYPEFEVHEIRKDQNCIAAYGHVTIGDVSLRKAMEGVNQHITIATAEGIKPVYAKDMTGEIAHKFRWPYFQAYGRCGAFVVFDDDSTGWVFNNQRSEKEQVIEDAIAEGYDPIVDL